MKMAIAQSFRRVVTTLIDVLHTRAELAVTELEEETVRYFVYLMLALTAMFCLGVAILLVILLIVAVYWDTHRIGVLVSLILFFLIAAAGISFTIRNRYRHKPRLLEHTLSEISTDVRTLMSKQVVQ